MVTEAVHPKRAHIDEQADMRDLNVLAADGLDEAIIGLVDIGDDNVVVAYSLKAIIKKLMAGGMDHGEAVEFFHFNIERGAVGVGSPVFVEDDF